MSTDVYLLRHGQTEGNVGNRWCGHTDTPLTALGVAQARAAGRHLAEVPFAGAIASDLSRAADTARHALHGREIPLTLDARLREMYYGDWEDLPGAHVEKEQPELLRAFMKCEAAPPGGETVRAIRERTAAALHDAVSRHRGSPILVVSHGNAMMALMAELLGMPQSATWAFAFDNCSITRLYVGRSGRATVFSLNHTAHVQGLADVHA
jgi:broad specificity phosphatase PhoE